MNKLPDAGPPDSYAGTVIVAAAMVCFACLAFLFLYGLFGPLLIAFVVLAVCGSLFVAMHYWLWGRSMPPAELTDESED